jgi:hypothetical protein
MEKKFYKNQNFINVTATLLIMIVGFYFGRDDFENAIQWFIKQLNLLSISLITLIIGNLIFNKYKKRNSKKNIETPNLTVKMDKNQEIAKKIAKEIKETGLEKTFKNMVIKIRKREFFKHDDNNLEYYIIKNVIEYDGQSATSLGDLPSLRYKLTELGNQVCEELI